MTEENFTPAQTKKNKLKKWECYHSDTEVITHPEDRNVTRLQEYKNENAKGSRISPPLLQTLLPLPP